MFVPDPVIKVAVNPASRADADKMSKALQKSGGKRGQYGKDD